MRSQEVSVGGPTRFVPSFIPSASVLQRAPQWAQRNDACIVITRIQNTCIVWGSLGSGTSAFREMPGELARDRPVPTRFCMGECVSTFHFIK